MNIADVFFSNLNLPSSFSSCFFHSADNIIAVDPDDVVLIPNLICAALYGTQKEMKQIHLIDLKLIKTY